MAKAKVKKKTSKTEFDMKQVPAQPKVAVENKVFNASKNDWEAKDRVYYLRDGLSPISYTIESRGIYWYDDEKGYEREIKYTENQKTPFVDEFKGDARLGHITFLDGVLKVPKRKQTLQKLLSLYHPQRNKLFYEFDAVEDAKDELVDLELEIEALNTAKNIDIDIAEAVLRVDQGNKVAQMTSKEIKRDTMLYAKKNPKLFLDLANDDNVTLRNFAIKASEARIINVSSDQRTVHWGTNNRKLMNVPFDENPFSALAAWFKTDEGMEVYKTIDKKLK